MAKDIPQACNYFDDESAVLKSNRLTLEHITDKERAIVIYFSSVNSTIR